MPNLTEESLLLHTRNRWLIPNDVAPEKNPVCQRESINIWRERLPDAKLRSITAKYNCMGMVFASRRAHVWPEHFQKIREDDGYRLVEREGDVQIGDVVVYLDDGEVTHVGIIITKRGNIAEARFEFEVMSKWGHDGEYIHPLMVVPSIFGKDVQFYTDRKLP